MPKNDGVKNGRRNFPPDNGRKHWVERRSESHGFYAYYFVEAYKKLWRKLGHEMPLLDLEYNNRLGPKTALSYRERSGEKGPVVAFHLNPEWMDDRHPDVFVTVFKQAMDLFAKRQGLDTTTYIPAVFWTPGFYHGGDSMTKDVFEVTFDGQPSKAKQGEKWRRF